MATPPAAVVELAARPVEFQAPDQASLDGLVYLRTTRPLTGADLEAGQEAGARYMGLLAGRTYAFELIRPAAEAWLQKLDVVVGVAEAKPYDRLSSGLIGYLSRTGFELASAHVQEGLGITVAFWPHATAGEVRALVGEPASLRLPSSETGHLGPESVMTVPFEDAQWLDLERLAASPAVATLGLDLPRVLSNEASRTLARSDVLFRSPFNLNGNGVLVGHWDGGAVDDNHPDFGSRVTNLTRSGVSAHATHTAGTVLGSGVGRASAAGHAPGARMVALSFNGNPTAERREVKHLYYHHHDNHSWGVNPDAVSNFGTYNQVGFEFDIDSRDLLLLPVKAAGNEGQQSEVIIDNFGFDSLSPDSTSKNAMVVGATNDSAQLAGYSSRGPTQDGRVKPDVVAVGTGVISTRPGGGYYRAQGTSMAAPGVTGILALLAEMFERGSDGRRMAPDVARGLLIHTAQDAFEPGPDFRFGWGVADAQAAAELIARDRDTGGQHIVRGAVRNEARLEYTLSVEAGASSLKVTLSWLDAFLNTTSRRRLVNDIDLFLVDPSGNRQQAWVLDAANPRQPATRGRNSVDNVEQVLVSEPAAGVWTVVVEGTDVSDPDLDVQGFVLVSDRPLERRVLRLTGGTPGTAVPDGQGELEIGFDVQEARVVEALRVFLDLKHEARGQVRVELQHPDGSRVVLETEDTSTRRDIYAIYPDLRSYDDDVTSFYGTSAQGRWVLRILDLEAGEVGELRHAGLEIDLGEPVNRPPLAVIAGPIQGSSRGTVMLSAAQSSDPDGDPLAFAWRQTEGPAATPQGENTDTLSLVLPQAETGTELKFEVLVADGRGGEAIAEHTLALTVTNRLPEARVDGPAQAAPRTVVTFDAGASSDPDGDPLTFRFVQVWGPAVVRPSAEGARWSFTVPDAAEGTRLGLSVQVSDGLGGEVSVPFELKISASADPENPGPPGSGGEVGGGPGSGLRPAGGCTAADHASPGLVLTLVLLFGCTQLRRSRRTPHSRRRRR